MSVSSVLRSLRSSIFGKPPPVVAVVPLNGVIGRVGALRRGLHIGGLAGVLERAFTLPEVAAVALAVNSPGGSPVQAALIARRIRALAAEHEVPVLAFAEDVAASGGYWLLVAGDEVFVDENSIVGSIGVISAGFGFTAMIERLGVERRVYKSGEHKAELDPFLAEDMDAVAHLKDIQGVVHESFRRYVRERRAGKLHTVEAELFSGRFWTGGRAVEMGLADALGDMRSVLRDRYGDKVKLQVVTDRRPWWKRRLGPTLQASVTADVAGVADGLVAAVEERLMWGRFGL